MRGNEIFEVRLDRNHHRDSTRITCYSRLYDVHYAIELRAMWGDPRRLEEYVDRLIGGSLRAWGSARVPPSSGRDMARDLLPHLEREIHRTMEQMERMDRDHYRYRNDMLDAARCTVGPHIWFADYAAPKEDPKAKEKARQLLLRNLDAGQEKSFKKDGTFRVTAQDGKVYTISTARSFNVKAEDGTKYCGQLSDTPVEDQMLAQKLLLEHEPEKFFKNANVSPVQPTTATEIAMRQREYSDMLMQPRIWYGGSV